MKMNDWITTIILLTVLMVFAVYVFNFGYKYFFRIEEGYIKARVY